MPQFRVNISTQQKGQLFSAGGSARAAQRMTTAINDFIANEGVQRIQRRLDQVLQNPTGYYRSNIQVERGAMYRGVSDGGVIYGGWLEGVSSRNRSTRFKGYRTFRIVQADLKQDSAALAQPFVDMFVREMNS